MKKFGLFFMVSVFLVVSCGKKSPPPAVSKPAGSYEKKKVVEKKQIKEEKYVYQGYKNRNPFFPSGGAATSPRISEVSSDGLIELSLVGIMTDINGNRYAILSDGSGQSFVLKDGWLYDFEDKRVPGYTGTVFEERVVLIHGSQMKELKLPE